MCCSVLSRYFSSLFRYFWISSGSSFILLYNLWNLFFAVLYDFDLKINEIFFTILSSSFSIFVYFRLWAFSFVVLFLVVFFFCCLYFFVYLFFEVLPFCPLYFSLILFISFSNSGISLFSFFIFRLRMLCFGVSSSMRFFMVWNVHL